MSGGDDAMFETDRAADFIARSDAERLDLKVLLLSLAGIGRREGERFLGVFISGDKDKGESSSGPWSNGWSSSHPSELAICRILFSAALLSAGEKPWSSFDMKSSDESSDGIDSLETDLVDKTEASTPSLPTNICPSTSSSMLPNSPSN